MVDSPLIGSDAWKGSISSGANAFLDRINKDALVKFASSLRDNRSCTLSDKFTSGCDHLVLKIEFDDGVKWVARLQTPFKQATSPTLKDRRRSLESELATMEFVR